MKETNITLNLTGYFITGILLVFCTSWMMAQDIDTNVPMGWAVVPGNGVESTTGGGDGDVVTATSLSQLKSYASSSQPLVILVEGTISGSGSIPIASNKTILGIGPETKLSGLELSMRNVSNIIIRNLKITKGVDGISARNTHHLWIDHCEVWDCIDGLIDITNESSYATVSWCKFYYENQTDHKLACLIGSGGGDHPEDWDKLKVTYNHCWFGNGVDQRMPRIMYGRVHVFNDYYSCSGNSYCIGVGSYGSALIENNHFKDINDPHVFMYDVYCWIIARGNYYDNTQGSRDIGKGGSRDVGIPGWAFPVRAFYTPPYLYKMDSAKDIPDIVTSGAGPQSQYGETGLMPVPGQGADKLNLNPTLQWTKGQSATDYIVSFGTTNPPPAVDTVSGQTYTPDLLGKGTVYYWSIDQVTPDDTIKGKVWSFRTKGPVPGRPYVSIISPTETDTFQAPANITIETEAWDSVGKIINVEFFEGFTPIGIDTSAPYSITWKNVKSGTYSINALITNNLGDAFTSEDAKFTVVNVIPYATITSPEYASAFTAPANITITADAYDDNGTVTSVEFFAGSTSIGTDDNPPYSVTWENVAAGKYYLSAKVTDNDGMSSKSTLVSITVLNPTNVANQNIENIALYPNPVSDKLVLNLNGNYSGNTCLTLYNTMGKIMMKETVSGSEHILDLEALPGGVYIITLTSNQMKIIRKIILN